MCGKLQSHHVQISSNASCCFLTVNSCDVFFLRGMSAAEAPLVSPQSSLPHRSLLAPCSGCQVCHGEVSTTSAHRGAVLMLKGEGEREEASTVKKKKKTWLLSGADASPLLCGWSAALLVREEQKVCSLLGPEVIPKVTREGKLASSLRCSPGGGGTADRGQVVVSRDVAVHREVVMAQGVFMWSVTEGTLTLCGQQHKQHTEINRGAFKMSLIKLHRQSCFSVSASVLLFCSPKNVPDS